MKIATFNINNINKRLDKALAWLGRTEPGYRLPPGTQSRAPRHFPGGCPSRHRLWRQLGRASGLERRGNPGTRLRSGAHQIEFAGKSGGLPASKRSIEATKRGPGRTLYLPNGNPQPGPKFNYKMAWFERLIDHAAGLMAAGVPVVLAGDYNVVPTAQDIYQTRSLDNNALVQPESRRAFARLVTQGWTDALRRLQPAGPLWTFWDYKRDRWQSDKGMRLDHVLLSPEISGRLIDGGVDRWVRGEENASDHAPAWIQLDL